MSRSTLERVTLFTMLLSAFFLRVLDLGGNSLWYDELLQVRIAQASLSEIIAALQPHAAMPLDYFVTRAMLGLGTNEFILRFPACAFSTLSVAVIYSVGRRMFSSPAGLLSAAFLAVSSFAVTYAHEARPYSLYLLFTLGSFYWLYRALQTNGLAHWLAYVVCIIGAVLTHLFAVFAILAQVLFVVGGLIVRAIKPSRAQLFCHIKRSTIVAVLVAALLFGAALAWTTYLDEVVGSAQRFVIFLTTLHVPPPEEWSGIAPGESPPFLTLDYLYTHVLENFSGGGIIASLSFLALGIGGLFSLRRKPWETILLLIWSVVPAALIFFFLMHRATLFAPRYLIASLPAWLLLCALGILALRTTFSSRTPSMPRAVTFLRPLALVLAVLFMVLSVDRTLAAIAIPKEDWRAAGRFLEANVRAGDAVLAPGGSYLIYHYAPRAETMHTPAELVEQVADAENHAARVWLILNRYVFDPGGTIKTWLQERGAAEVQVDRWIEVYYWRKGAGDAELLTEVRAMQLPETALAYSSLAEQVALHGDLDNARTIFEQAVARASAASESAAGKSVWADVERRAGNVERAALLYRQAVALDDRQIAAWVGLARVYLEQGELEAAHDALTRALALDGSSYPARLFLAEYYDRTGQADAAQRMYARAAEIVPELTTPP